MLQSTLCAACVFTFLTGVAPSDTGAAGGAPAAAIAADDPQAHGFDFLMGTWNVRNTFLAKRMQHSHEWRRFPASAIEQPLRTGTGNLEYYLTGQWPHFVGMAWQVIDHEHARWSQAFSSDHGRTWETNWIMNFTRIPETANATILPGALHPAHR